MIASFGSVYPVTGTATTVPSANIVSVVNPNNKRPAVARELVISNNGATNALKVWLAPSPFGGKGVAETEAFITVPANSSKTLHGPIVRIVLASAAATTPYDIAITIG